jgi:cell division protein FtsL
MKGETFEYAIKKDVRNNPIVREVDRERHREMWRSLAVGSFLVAVLVFVVWRHNELLFSGYQIGDIQSARVQQEKLNETLRLEIETLKSLSRLEIFAKRDLRMVVPAPEDHGVIERVVADDSPSSSVLAQR